MYTECGDMIIKPPEEIRLRRVGWQINGGPNDGLMVKEITEEHRSVPIGGFSPLYIEIGD